MWFTLTLTVIIAALLYKLLFSNPYKNHWRNHNVFEMDISNACSTLDLLLGRKPNHAADDYIYENLPSQHKFCGMVLEGSPCIVVKDLDLIKRVLIKDFEYFVDRRKFLNKSDGALERMLMNLQGEEWKGVRSSISPTFTTGKIRRMMECFNEIGKEWVGSLMQSCANNDGFSDAEVLPRVNQYTIDVIASAVFGLNAGCVKNPDGEFAKNALSLQSITASQLAKLFLRFQFPKLSEFFNVSIIGNPKAIEFFTEILKQTLKERMKSELTRNDFLQLLVEATKGEVKASGSDELSDFEKDAKIQNDSKRQYLTEENMVAQCLAFFFAGFSTTGNFITFALYALALNPEIQEKLRSEVNTIVKENGSFDYDDLGKLVYLEMIACEVNRKFTAEGRLERLCIKDYRDAESGLFAPKGTVMVIPSRSIHQDKQFYKNPDAFDPEHFSPEAKANRNPYAYMPFGIGPRNCIGMRFALVQGKAAIAHVVRNFKIEPTPKTPVPLQGRQTSFQLLPPTGLQLRFTPIRR